ncbi:hypothetical protein KCU77_g110, partial [Aureobasidium melanogenum]
LLGCIETSWSEADALSLVDTNDVRHFEEVTLGQRLRGSLGEPVSIDDGAVTSSLSKGRVDDRVERISGYFAKTVKHRTSTITSCGLADIGDDGFPIFDIEVSN